MLEALYKTKIHWYTKIIAPAAKLTQNPKPQPHLRTIPAATTPIPSANPPRSDSVYLWARGWISRGGGVPERQCFLIFLFLN